MVNGKKKKALVIKNGQSRKKPFMLNGKKINVVMKKDGKNGKKMIKCTGKKNLKRIDTI